MARDDQDDERFGGKAWTLVGAATILLAILAYGIWFVVIRGDDSTASRSETVTPNEAPDSSERAATPASDGYVGPREIVGGVPMGFPHTEEGATSAAVTWLSHAVVWPRTDRQPGITEVFADETLLPPAIDGSRAISMSVVAANSGITDDAGVVHLLVAAAYDQHEFDEMVWVLHEFTLGMAWDAEADDWRITTLDSSEQLEPPYDRERFSEYEWLVPTGAETLGFPLTPES